MRNNQQENDEIEIDLMEVASELWHRKLIIILAALVVGLGAVLFSTIFITPQ